MASTLKIAKDHRRPVLLGQLAEFVADKAAKIPALDFDGSVVQRMVFFRQTAGEFDSIWCGECRAQLSERDFAPTHPSRVGAGTQR
jgi:hypothetical protein